MVGWSFSGLKFIALNQCADKKEVHNGAECCNSVLAIADTSYNSGSEEPGKG